MTWRLIEDDGVGAASGLAGDEILTRSAAHGSPTIRLYTYRPHAALVGRFQNAESEVHLDACDRAGIQINRRPTGGGAILMGPDQLGVALCLRGRGNNAEGRPRELMSRFSQGLIRGLQSLGIDAAFRGKNDLEVDGKKIAGLGIHRDPSGGLLFHASLLVDLDIPLMSRVLKAPFQNRTDSELETVSTRTSTVRQLLGNRVSTQDVRGSVAKGFSEAFSVTLVAGRLSDDETAAIEDLVRQKYGTTSWVHQRTPVEDTTGSASIRSSGGTIEVHVSLAGRMIKSLAIRGDFFEDDGALADLEARLRWHSATVDSIEKVLGSWKERFRGTLDRESLLRAITDAVGLAQSTGSAPYACFAHPEASNA